MSNRLEEEFPHTSWRAIPPVGLRGLDQDLLRRYIARGHVLRSRAVGRGVHTAGAGLARVVVALAALVRCAAPGLPKLPAGQERWRSPAPDA
jgi:hypothetical protein